jgi:hypothetical protein
MDWIREDVVAVIREMCEEEKQTVVSGGDERFMNAGEDRERMASTGSYAQYAPRAQPARRRAETASIDHIIEPHHLCPPRPRPRPSLPDRDRSVRPRWMTERLCDAGTRRRGALHWQACSQLQRLADMSWSSQRRREKRCNASHQDLHTTTLRREIYLHNLTEMKPSVTTLKQNSPTCFASLNSQSSTVICLTTCLLADVTIVVVDGRVPGKDNKPA